MPKKSWVILRTVKLDGILPDAVCHGDALVFAAVPICVRAVHVEGAALVTHVLVVARREMGPVVAPEAFCVDACPNKMHTIIEIGKAHSNQKAIWFIFCPFEIFSAIIV